MRTFQPEPDSTPPPQKHLSESHALVHMLKAQASANRLVAAICAAPEVVLHAKGILGDRRATAYPSFAEKLSNKKDIEKRVVVDGNFGTYLSPVNAVQCRLKSTCSSTPVTSRGPGTAMEFACEIIHKLCGKETAEKVNSTVLAPTRFTPAE